MTLVFQIYFSISMIAFTVTSVKVLGVMIITILENGETIPYFRLLCNLNLAYNIVGRTAHTAVSINFGNSPRENIKPTTRFRVQVMGRPCLICVDSANPADTKLSTRNTALLTSSFLACRQKKVFICCNQSVSMTWTSGCTPNSTRKTTNLGG